MTPYNLYNLLVHNANGAPVVIQLADYTDEQIEELRGFLDDAAYPEVLGYRLVWKKDATASNQFLVSYMSGPDLPELEVIEK